MDMDTDINRSSESDTESDADTEIYTDGYGHVLTKQNLKTFIGPLGV